MFLILWLRRPDSLLNAQFWAEDGAVFFQQQFLDGFWKSLPSAYSGYLHAVPRIVAAFACLLPIRWVPLCFNATSLLIAAVSCSSFFLKCYRPLMRSDALRAACCLTAAAAVPAGQELIATVCNLQWYLAILSLLLIVAVHGNRLNKFAECALALVQVLIALTAPSTLSYLPFLLWQLKSKPGLLKVRPAIHASALLLQAAVIRHNPVKPFLQVNLLFLATLSSGITRCVLKPMFGPAFLDRGIFSLLTIMLWVLIIGVILSTVLCLKADRHQARWLLPAAYVAVASLLMVLSARGIAKDFLQVEGIQHSLGERYFFVPTCMFIFCLGSALECLLAKTVGSRIALAIFVLCFGIGTLKNFAVRPFADYRWSESAAKIERWNRDRQASGSISVPINPEWFIILTPER